MSRSQREVLHITLHTNGKHLPHHNAVRPSAEYRNIHIILIRKLLFGLYDQSPYNTLHHAL